eukprot:4206772-Lingulodinium_polyedra.AAC.1
MPRVKSYAAVGATQCGGVAGRGQVGVGMGLRGRPVGGVFLPGFGCCFRQCLSRPALRARQVGRGGGFD